MKKMLKVVAVMLALTIAFGCMIAFAENTEEGTTEQVVVIETPAASEAPEVQEPAPASTEAPAAEVAQEAAAEEVVEEVPGVEEIVEESAVEEPELIEIPDEEVPLFGGAQPQVEIDTNCDVASMELGDELVLTAKLTGFEGIDYSLNWQVSKGGEWEDIKGETEKELTVVITEENADCSWRLAVNVPEA